MNPFWRQEQDQICPQLDNAPEDDGRWIVHDRRQWDYLLLGNLEHLRDPIDQQCPELTLRQRAGLQ
jgi:hypothetical protein